MEAIKDVVGKSGEKEVAGCMEQPVDLHVQVFGFASINSVLKY